MFNITAHLKRISKVDKTNRGLIFFGAQEGVGLETIDAMFVCSGDFTVIDRKSELKINNSDEAFRLLDNIKGRKLNGKDIFWIEISGSIEKIDINNIDGVIEPMLICRVREIEIV